MTLDAKVKLIVIDVDGTLTDGKYYVSSDGFVTKCFHTYDFMAIRIMSLLGVNVLFLTSSSGESIIKKVEKFTKAFT
ncbi:MAG: hypothetical protein ACOC5T_04440, partial [Elusimicrobiota bacterium]